MIHRQDDTPHAVRLAIGALVAGLALLTAHNWLHMAWPPVLPSSWWDWLYNALEIAAAVLCGARAVARRRDRPAWLAVTIGIALFAAADMYYSLAWGDANVVPFPSLADALYLSFYPAVYVGIGLLLRSRVGRLPAGLWLDGVIGGLAVAALGATIVFGPVLSNTHGAVLTVATNLAYPLADLLLLGILVGIMALTGFSVRGQWPVIAIGFIVFAVADSIYLVQTANGTYVSNGLLDVGWPAGLGIIAMGAWRRPAGKTRPRLDGWGIFVLPSVAAVACLALEFYDHYHRLSFIAHLLASACLLLVIVRLGISFAENVRMLRASRHEAVTDALTGLGNRRALEPALHDRLHGDDVRPFVVAFYDLDGFKTYNDTFGHQAGDMLLARLGARVVAAMPEADVFRLGGDEFCVLVDEADGGEAGVLTAAAALEEHGSTFDVGCSFGMVRVPEETTDAETAMVLADARMYEHKNGRRPDAATESQDVLVRALVERNRELGEHNDEVASLVVAVSRELGLEPGEIVAARRAAELHDVGKLAIPDAILNKPGALSEQEWEFMRQHTIVGERIVASATSLSDVAPIVRSSHERWDGGGYPDGLAGEAIPLGARIIAVCDAYDAMTTTRPYRKAMRETDAVAELRRCAGHQFDPRVVAAFERAIGTDRVDAVERLAA
ncbi:MAG TPA: diguanylate cyclase [Solirubrobacteraceae bacterium]|nr:diguanylate cyclase [Solirubrobacteraceae bacterium]